MLSKIIRKIGSESDLDKKVVAVSELSAQIEVQKVRTARFAKFAWVLDMLFLLLAILVFYIPFFYEYIKDYLTDVLPAEICRMIEPVYNALYADDMILTDEVKGWLYCLLGLVVLPVVFYVILAIVNNHSPNATVKPLNEVRAGTPEKLKLRYMEETLENAKSELFSMFYSICGFVLVLGIILCALFAVPIAIIIPMAVDANILEYIFVDIFAVALFAVLFMLLIFLKACVLILCFSIMKDEKQVDQLYDRFIKEAKKICPAYMTREEEREAEKRRKERELEREWILYRAEHPSSIGTGYYTGGYSSSTSRDDDALDAVAQAMSDEYGSDWGRDL